jgi:hypothetical protein
MGINDNPLGVSGTTLSGLGDQNGALYQFLKQTSGGSSNAQRAIDLAGQLVPQYQEVNPWEVAFQYFAEMGRQASQPGATAFGAAVGSMQVPLDYLNAKKKEKRESDSARLQTALTLGPSLKPPAVGKDSYVDVTVDGVAQVMTSSEISAAKAAGKVVSPYSATSNAAPTKPFDIKITDIPAFKTIYPNVRLPETGIIALRADEVARLAPGSYELIERPTGEGAKAAKYADDGTGVIRYTENPPEGKSIGDEVFAGIDISGFTTNDRIFAGELRDDLTRALGDFEDINSSMKDINSFYTLATTTANPISDYSLAVQYAKIIDPGTAAREGEVAAIASAGSLTGAARAQIINAIFGNGKLSPKMRASIFNNSVKIYDSKLPGALSKIKRYKTVANTQKEGLFSLVGLNVDVDETGKVLYRGVGGDPAVDTNNYHLIDLSNMAEDPLDLNPDALVFPEDFSFDGFTRSALISMLALPPGALDAATLDKLEAALADL